MSAGDKTIVTQAAQAHGIDPGVLWGIYGAESSFGAGGTNWFGLIAVPRTGSFAGDANAAASTLANLLHQNGGNYDAALRQYSGGSYGLDHVKSLAAQSGTSVNASGSGSRSSSSGANFWQDILHALVWVAIVISGGGLVLLGARQLFAGKQAAAA